MKVIYTGLESAGKTLLMARSIKQSLILSTAYYKKYGFIRPVYCNIHLSSELLEKYGMFYSYYDDIQELIDKKVAGCDIYHDEISSDFSALKKDKLPRATNRWLRQGAKNGVRYYATAQEYNDIHLDFRRRVSVAYEVKKIMGSSRGGLNLPPVKTIWGVCLVKKLDIFPYNEIQRQYVFNGIFPFVFFGKRLCSIFDTHQIIEETDNNLEHTETYCPTCGYTEIYHNGRKTKSFYAKK